MAHEKGCVLGGTGPLGMKLSLAVPAPASRDVPGSISFPVGLPGIDCHTSFLGRLRCLRVGPASTLLRCSGDRVSRVCLGKELDMDSHDLGSQIFLLTPSLTLASRPNYRGLAHPSKVEGRSCPVCFLWSPL